MKGIRWKLVSAVTRKRKTKKTARHMERLNKIKSACKQKKKVLSTASRNYGEIMLYSVIYKVHFDFMRLSQREMVNVKLGGNQCLFLHPSQAKREGI